MEVEAEPIVEHKSAPLRVLIVSENISMKMGGESSLPFYYAKLFRERGVEVQLACHERVRGEVRAAFPDMGSGIHFVGDTRLQKALHRYGEKLGMRVKVAFTEQAIHLISQTRIRKIARRLASEGKIDVVLEPAPITPKGVSLMYGVGVPVVIGPLCGGMSFPPAFRDFDSALSRSLVDLGRKASGMVHRLLPGKLYADAIFVANTQTRRALPKGLRGRVIQLFESGVDLELWKPEATGRTAGDDVVRFAFSGWFKDWKGVRFLVSAFEKVARTEGNCELHLVGGGELDQEIRSQVRRAGLDAKVRFHGWMDRADAARILKDSDVFVMPSLRECGGTAILEALALGKPVIATNWGGPADYLNDSCGLLVDPSSREGFVDGLADAMIRLGRSEELRRSLGVGGMARVREDGLDWDSKADRVLVVLRDLVGERRSSGARSGTGAFQGTI